MKPLRIFVDLAASETAVQLLKSGTRNHELIFPDAPAASVLDQSGPNALQLLENADIAFGQPNPEGLTTAARLKWVHISSSGITRYDNPEFRSMMLRRGIPVSNSASVYNEPCAVHALSFMLAQARQLPLGLASRAENGGQGWNSLRADSSTLRGETVLILGFGAIGRRLAELLAPFGMNILGYRRSPRGDEAVQMVAKSDLNSALGRADHVMNILPESAETRGFFEGHRFAAMKRGAVFYNIGRGATVDQTALREALRSGQLAAAWLDVTDPEPLPDDHPLRLEPNCYITPHTAGGHPDETSSLVRHFLGNLERFVRGEPLVDRVM